MADRCEHSSDAVLLVFLVRFCRKCRVASAARSSKCSAAATEALHAECPQPIREAVADREKWEGYHACNLLIQCHGAGAIPATR